MFLKSASNQHYSGCSLSSIKLALKSFSTQEKIRFFESYKNLTLLSDDDGDSFLLLHNFHLMPPNEHKQEHKLIATAGFDTFSAPVIINTHSIKNYSQIAPKWENLQDIMTTMGCKDYNSNVETTTISNAIIIPLPLLRIILSANVQSPASLALLLINEMKRLDSLTRLTTANTNSSQPNDSPRHILYIILS
jgi:hypothetical protein